jgi:uncharacterized protein YqfB (UPF0267 family)
MRDVTPLARLLLHQPETMNIHIYTLYSSDGKGNRNVFYIGITSRPKQRLQEHQRESKKGHTAKYTHIRSLENRGYEWGLKVIKSIDDGIYPQDYERFYVIQYLRNGYELTNMKYGNSEKKREISEQVQNIHIRSISDVIRDRITRKEVKKSNLQEREFKRALKEEGILSVKGCSFIPKQLKEGLLAGTAFHDLIIEKGVPYEDLQQAASKEGIATTRKLRDMLNAKTNQVK